MSIKFVNTPSLEGMDAQITPVVGENPLLPDSHRSGAPLHRCEPSGADGSQARTVPGLCSGL